jgi:hypothetical protein
MPRKGAVEPPPIVGGRLKDRAAAVWAWVDRLGGHQAGAFFVTRTKSNVKYHRVHGNRV